MKSLEARKADRAKRNEEAEEAKKQASEVLASGTMADKSRNADANDAAYADWTVAELKSELDTRGVDYDSTAKKADLVAALEADDEAAE